jgi:LacI family transcriptional regulator
MKKDKPNLTGVKEIARRGNVSIATVDRVIHNRTGVSQQTKAKIQEIIAELNYQPNLLAQRLATRKVIRLATLIPMSSEETSFWEGPLKGIEQADREINQFAITIDKYFYDQNLKNSFIEQSEKILESKPDGVLLAPSSVDEAVIFTENCKKLNIPYVLIDSDLPTKGSLSYIGGDLYQSGYLGAHLISYLIKDNDAILLLNISKEIDNDHHLIKKGEGFRAYFKDHNRSNNILKIDIRETDYASIDKSLEVSFEANKDIKVVFVTNSRVANVAHYIEKSGRKVILIGYDFLNRNVEYLDKGIIDFLICQKPLEQAYQGVMTLYKHLAISLPVEKVQFMPIDIITKENYSFYG